MYVVTANQIRELDRRAMEEAGMPGVVLMENAGRSVVDFIERELGPVSGRRAALFCGTGNNGGDGFVILRLLRLAGADVTLFCADDAIDAARSKSDAATHLQVVIQTAKDCLEPLPPEQTLAENSDRWRGRFNFAVDALLGTGIKDAPRGWYARAIRAVNALDCPIVAVDIPSGVDADTGATPGEAVRAQSTVTFAYPKLGLYLHPGHECAGRVAVSDIGFAWPALGPPSEVRVSGVRSAAHPDGAPGRFAEWEPLLRKRPPESNKGDFGHVGILAGSRGMVGAPALVARAAQRAGSGLVTVLTPESAQPIIAGKLDEQMTLSLAETDGAVSEPAWDAVASFARKSSVMCIGPGLTVAPQTVSIVQRALRELTVPIVLDADGLNALAMDPAPALERSRDSIGPLVITPHPGEASRLLGTSIAQVQSDRMAAVRALAKQFHCVAVLKGRYTLTADPEGSVIVNTTGNPGMATGGMGDTLTGIIGALMAQNAARAKRNEESVATLYAAALAVHIHGVAGDIAASATGEAGLTAGDVIGRLPEAIRFLIDND